MTGAGTGQPVQIVMIEDDEGHARLIERNIRRAGINNEIVPFTSGTEALAYLLGSDRSGAINAKRAPVVVLTTTDDQREIQRCYDLGANVYIVKPVNYESFANAIRQLGLFLSVIQVP